MLQKHVGVLPLANKATHGHLSRALPRKVTKKLLSVRTVRLKWLYLKTDQECLWLTLMADQNCRKMVEIKRFLQLLVLAETINHL